MTRLDAVCSLIIPAGTIADVGCDHGIVARYLSDNSGLCEQVIASDISEQCLNKAKAALGGRCNVRFVLCDGICYDCDEAVIAGMGGVLIAEILKKAKPLPNTLVLCPHRNSEEVRTALTELGYCIERDMIVKERGKFYFVLRASKGAEHTPLTELQILFGKHYDEKNAILQEYLTKQYNTYAVAPEQNKLKLDAIKAAIAAQTR
ncbi:MAG: SAM-dependent methyltransferase [Clostridiales bacterium]|nr:SAM-dependent methyltransferase [Clostridiales bacterium]